MHVPLLRSLDCVVGAIAIAMALLWSFLLRYIPKHSHASNWQEFSTRFCKGQTFTLHICFELCLFTKQMQLVV